jgi:glucose-1-phosphatase
MYSPAIRNIIFDLGGVILNLHVDKTRQAFGSLAGIAAGKEQDGLLHDPLFNQYEKGLISDEQFRDHLCKLLKIKATDQQVDDAWNAMLGTLPPGRLELLERLAKNHRIFLLSNTNNIHLQRFNAIAQAAGVGSTLDSYFERAYYSHLLKMRKPDVEIFEHVLRENKLIPRETLFLDDNVDNLRGAELAGIKTAHITHPDLIFSVFP